MTPFRTAALLIVLSFGVIGDAAGQGSVAAPMAEGYHAEDVVFEDGGHRLAGTLYTPLTEGPHPAIVLLSGSGATDRTSFGYFPHIQPTFLLRGMAVLVYDKPGVGESTGDHLTMTLRDRAREASAAVRFLQGRPDIRNKVIGLWGGSQGGWVAPLAATMSNDVAFVITVSAPAISPAEQDVHGLANLLQSDGHPDSVVEAGREWGRQIMDAAASGVPYEDVRETLLKPAEGTPWYEIWGISNEAMWGYLTAVDPETGEPSVLYDPVPVLQSLTTPILAIFGEADPLVPVAGSVEIMEQALQQAGNSDYLIRVFPDADHGIFVEPRVFAPGYLELMGEWVARYIE